SRKLSLSGKVPVSKARSFDLFLKKEEQLLFFFFDKLRNSYLFLFEKMIYLIRINIGLTSEV
ncbi:hypothetical protein NXY55_22185, partial [Aeromonas veronii]|nr:hypothetical protein [Aeromonas veronii]